MENPLTTKAQTVLSDTFNPAVCNALTKAAQTSDFFAGLLDAFASNKGATIMLGNTANNPKEGTSVTGKTITIDSDLLPGSGTEYELSASVFATVLAHELAHADLPGGISATASNPDQAVANGQSSEGVALTAEYIVAKQLGTCEGQRGQTATYNKALNAKR